MHDRGVLAAPLHASTGGGVTRNRSQGIAVQVEKAMITNLRAIMAQAVAAYATTARKKWVLEWPGQAVLAVSGIYWTQQVRCDTQPWYPRLTCGAYCAHRLTATSMSNPTVLERSAFAMHAAVMYIQAPGCTWLRFGGSTCQVRVLLLCLSAFERENLGSSSMLVATAEIQSF